MKRIFLSLVGMLIFQISYSQTPYFDEFHDTTDYYDIRASVQMFYDTLGYDDSVFMDTSNYYRNSMRWNSFFSSRIGSASSGSSLMNPASQMFKNVLDEQIQYCAGSPHNKDWASLGIDQLPGGGRAAGNGRIDAIAVDPNDDDVIYIGAATGGIYKTENGKSANPTWKLKTNSSRLITFGVSNIKIVTWSDPPSTPHKRIYATSGVLNVVNSEYGVAGLIYSDDGGDTWDVALSGFKDESGTIKRYRMLGLAVSPDPLEYNTVLVSRENELLMSTNGGQSFQVMKTITPTDKYRTRVINDIEFNIDNPDIIMFTVTDRGEGDGGAMVYLSTDGGSTYSDVTSNMLNSITLSFDGNLERLDISTSPDDPESFYILAVDAVNGLSRRHIVLKYDGSSWVQLSSAWDFNNSISVWKSNILVSKTDHNTIYLGGVQIQRSTNNGASFAFLTNNANHHDDVRSLYSYIDGNNDEILLSGNDGGLNKLINGGTPSTRLNGFGLNISQIYRIDVACNGTRIFGGMQDLSVNFYDKSTGQWENNGVYADGGDIEPHPYIRDQVYSSQFFSESRFINESDDCGDNNGGFNNGVPICGTCGYYIRPLAANRYPLLFTVTDQVYFIDITNTANNQWEDPISNVETNGRNISTIHAPYDHPNYVYIAYEDGTNGSGGTVGQRMYYTTNALNGLTDPTNVSWEAIGDVQGGDDLDAYQAAWVTDMCTDPDDPNRIWVVFGGFVGNGKVYYRDMDPPSNDPDSISEWVNVTNNLPNFPIQSIIYQRGTDDEIYIGTDVGVYYNSDPDNKGSNWQCVNKGWNAPIVNDLQIDYCSQKLLAGTFGYGLWEVDLVNPPSKTIDITANTTWEESNPIKIYQNVIVKSGNSLTIKSDVWFASDRTIYVETGAKLIIQGATLTSMCGNEMWGGIIVEGDITKTQDNISDQGRVILSKFGPNKYATIEHAKNGISLIGLNSSGELDFNKTGGIVKAFRAIFRDNKRDLEFMKYENRNSTMERSNRNKSVLIGCVFETTDNYHGVHDEIEPHITMWGVEWVEIGACIFEDKRSSTVVPDRLDRRDGIYTINASYRIRCENNYLFPPLTGPCSGGRTEFRNMRYAIRSVSGQTNTSSLPISIEDAIFGDKNAPSPSYCVGGVELIGEESFILNNCEFNIAGYSGSSTFRDIEAFGLYLDNCTHYQVEGNHFYSNYSTAGGSGDYGIGMIIRQNKDRENEVYRNFVDDYYFGSEAIGWNRYRDLMDRSKGLEYLCNEFDHDEIDIFVIHDEEIIHSNEHKGLPQQGDFTKPAGNLFGVYTGLEYHIFHNPMYDPIIDPPYKVEYFHHDPVGNARVLPSKKFNVLNVKTEFPYGTSYCPDLTNQGINVTQAEKDDLESIQLLKTQKKNEVNDKIDGGDREGLIDAIINATGGNLSAVLTELQIASPYLSDTVLQLLARQETTSTPFSFENVRDIMFLNPHSGRNSVLLGILGNRNDAFPTAYIEDIDSVGQYFTDRDTLLSDAHYYSKQYSQKLNTIIIKCLHDSIDQFTETLEPILKEADEPEYKYLLSSIYDNRKYSSRASQTLDSIPIVCTLTAIDSSYLQSYKDLRSLLNYWNSTGVDLLNLDGNQIDTLFTFYYQSNGISNKVIPLLVMNDTLTYIPPTYDYEPPSEANPGILNLEELNELKNEGNRLQVFPNPTSENLNVHYSVTSKLPNLRIDIYDLNGKLIITRKLEDSEATVEIMVNGLQDGNYICLLNSGRGKLAYKKFAIFK